MATKQRVEGDGNQHYVPRLLLRGFSGPSGRQVFMFDKTDRRAIPVNLRKAAAQKRFYNVTVPGAGEMTIEPSLADLESRAGQVLGRVRKSESLASLSDDDRFTLAYFALVQERRTDAHKKKLKDAHEKLGREVVRLARQLGAPAALEAQIHPLDDETTQQLFLDGILNVHDLVPMLLEKSLVLYRAPEGSPLIIGDSPLTKQNSSGPKGRLDRMSLNGEGIEVYLPISDRLTLAWLCGSIEERVRKHGPAVSALSPLAGALSPTLARAVHTGRSMLNAFDKGTPIPLDSENVENLNSLQVTHSERFVFGRSKDFSLVNRMLDDHPFLRSGPRVRILSAPRADSGVDDGAVSKEDRP